MSLPEPSFITRDPAAVTAEMVTQYEAMTGKTLQPAQVERVLIDLIAYRESLLRIAIQEAAKQNLVEFAHYPMLDYLGALVGVARLEARPAVTRIRFDLAVASGVDTIIPAGTVIASKDGVVNFTTDTALVISAGQTTGEVAATATTAGTTGNGYLAGEVNSLTTPLAGITAASTTFTSGGADAEDDDRLRERIKQAPESFSNAGSRGAYRYWAMTAHQSIVDVAVLSPSAGVVQIYPLTVDGTPSQGILDAVEATCNADTVRPLTDDVHAVAPQAKPFAIACSITPTVAADPAILVQQVQTALEAVATDLRRSLGRDLVVHRLIAAAQDVTGVYKAAITSPVADETNADNEWSDCTGITITLTEAVNG
ncbi:MAG: baseplate J/gp47 family protein [Geobacter sp.]|nr:baseplate J/gp47 family protein [Geobacter sp.]